MRTQSERRSPLPIALELAVVLAVSCWCIPAHAFPHHDAVHKEIEGLEMEWRQALLTGNLDTIDRLLADDYLGISANGMLETKADAVAASRSGRLKIVQLDISDIKIRIYGDTAVVTSKADMTGTSHGQDISGHYRYTHVYTKHADQWKIVSFEASRISHHSRRGSPSAAPVPIPNS